MKPFEIARGVELLERVASGATSIVFRAQATNDLDYAVRGAPLAVKIFKDEAQGATAERLTREVQIGLACRCPQLIRYFDHDIAATQLGDQPFVVMEWFSGSTLEQLAPQIIALSPLRRRRHLRSVLCQALHGLQYLHQRGVVHRDLQRRNILVASNGAVKIIDFGTAKHAAPSDITERWEEIGTRRYWPPEYFRYVAAPDAWDVAGDLFMLASCLVHAYTGKFIFAEADNYQKFFARLQEYALEYKTNIPELETCKSWMSRSLYGALNIMLSPRPDDRTDATTLIKLLSGNFTRVAKRLPRDAFPLTALVWSLSSEQESLATALLDYFGDRFGAQEAPHMAANDLHFLDQFRRLTGKSIISLVRRFVLFGLLRIEPTESDDWTGMYHVDQDETDRVFREGVTIFPTSTFYAVRAAGKRFGPVVAEKTMARVLMRNEPSYKALSFWDRELLKVGGELFLTEEKHTIVDDYYVAKAAGIIDPMYLNNVAWESGILTKDIWRRSRERVD